MDIAVSVHLDPCLGLSLALVFAAACLGGSVSALVTGSIVCVRHVWGRK
jgi:hypothetical protein